MERVERINMGNKEFAISKRYPLSNRGVVSIFGARVGVSLLLLRCKSQPVFSHFWCKGQTVNKSAL